VAAAFDGVGVVVAQGIAEILPHEDLAGWAFGHHGRTSAGQLAENDPGNALLTASVVRVRLHEALVGSVAGAGAQLRDWVTAELR